MPFVSVTDEAAWVPGCYPRGIRFFTESRKLSSVVWEVVCYLLKGYTDGLHFIFCFCCSQATSQHASFGHLQSVATDGPHPTHTAWQNRTRPQANCQALTCRQLCAAIYNPAHLLGIYHTWQSWGFLKTSVEGNARRPQKLTHVLRHQLVGPCVSLSKVHNASWKIQFIKLNQIESLTVLIYFNGREEHVR